MNLPFRLHWYLRHHGPQRCPPYQRDRRRMALAHAFDRSEGRSFGKALYSHVLALPVSLVVAFGLTRFVRTMPPWTPTHYPATLIPAALLLVIAIAADYGSACCLRRFDQRNTIIVAAQPPHFSLCASSLCLPSCPPFSVDGRVPVWKAVPSAEQLTQDGERSYTTLRRSTEVSI
jgi:hypothetical protein